MRRDPVAAVSAALDEIPRCFCFPDDHAAVYRWHTVNGERRMYVHCEHCATLRQESP